ncbi:MAG: hypothetical protein M0Q54_03550 [Pigmentiphaga sp.]|nr:hypothetical protein [Pigmentiphaga sp.]
MHVDRQDLVCYVVHATGHDGTSYWGALNESQRWLTTLDEAAGAQAKRIGIACCSLNETLKREVMHALGKESVYDLQAYRLFQQQDSDQCARVISQKVLVPPPAAKLPSHPSEIDSMPFNTFY